MNETRRLVEEEEGTDPTDLVLQATRESRLLLCACTNDYLGALRYFVEERNANVRVRDTLGRTLLHHACESQSFEIVKYLVETGTIDIEAGDKMYERTPLHYACIYGPRRVAMYLVEKGANVNAKDKRGRTGLDYVVLDVVGRSDGDYVLGSDSSSDLGSDSSSDDDVPDLADRLDLIRFLIPRTCIRLDTNLEDVWRAPLFPWDVKELLITTSAKQDLDVSDVYCQLFPMHTFLRVPLLPEEVFLGGIRHYRNHTSSRSFDSDGRLPIHAALEALGSPRNTVVTPRVILELLELEPRSAFFRDSRTGLFPFEAAAAAASASASQETLSCERLQDRDFLNLIYQLLRCNPERLLTSRGSVGNGESMVENVRQGKRRKTKKNPPEIPTSNAGNSSS